MMEPHNHGPNAGLVELVSRTEQRAAEARMQLHADSLKRRVDQLAKMVQRRIDDLSIDLHRARETTEEIGDGNYATAVNYHQPLFGSPGKSLDQLLRALATANEQLADTLALMAAGKELAGEAEAAVAGMFPDGLPDDMAVKPPVPVGAGGENGLYL